jgi:hypothetical protein
MPPVKRLLPALTALLLILAGTAYAQFPAQSSSTREIGDFSDQPFPQAGCPNSCQAIGHVTGYQVQIGSHKNPFVIRQNGKIVAFTIRLGKPDAQQTQFFTNLFGGAPQARLTVLRTARTAKRARLVAQSEVFNLANYLGSTPTFALSKPLAVTAGSTLAVTVPTWAPAFAINLGADQAWRSSRAKNDCNGTSQSAQQTVGSLHQYPCFYRTARLLYSASFVPDPKPTTPAGKKP